MKLPVSILAALLILTISQSCSKSDHLFYVSPSGNDSNTGTINAPFASLLKARDAVRELTGTDLDRDIIVYIREGTYILDQTLIFGLQDGGSEEFSISYEAYPGETVILSSGIKIDNWAPVEDLPGAIPEIAHGRIWEADLPASLDLFYTMYDNEKMLPRARSAGLNSTKKMGTDIGIFAPVEEKRTLYYPEGTLRNWENLSDIEIFTYPTVGWTVNMLHLESVDEDRLVAKTSIPATYPIRYLKGRTPMQLPYGIWVENTPEALDRPGEWVVNTRERKIWYWPESGNPGDHIVVPGLQELIKVEGTIDINGPEDIPVRNLHFKGLTFMHGERDTWEWGDRGIQHDWEMMDKPTALMRFRGAEGCSVEKCRFTSSGGTGMRLDQHCQQISVKGNLFEDLGNMGILLCGYGPGTKDVNHNNSVSNNILRRCGQIYYHGHGIFLFQSGSNLVSHNTIYDMPRKAIGIGGVRPKYYVDHDPDHRQCGASIRIAEIDWQSLEGKDYFEMYPLLLPYFHSKENIVEYNHCWNVLQKGADGAAINITASGYGNIIRHNFVESLPNPLTAGIRLDGSTRRTEIYNNILVNAHGILPKPPENNTYNNIMVFTEFQTRIPKKAVPLTIYSGVKGRNVRNVAYYTSNPAMPDDRQKTIQPVLNNLDSNLYYSVEMQEEALLLLEGYQNKGMEVNSLFADPLFMDVLNKDFRLRDGSPLRSLGFEEISLEGIGINEDYPEEWRETLSIDQEDLLDMYDIIQPVPLSAAFHLEGYGVWGNSVTKAGDGEFYMFFSCVPNGLQHTNSRIGYASSDSPTGPWTFEGIALPHGKSWDSCYTHNPSIFKHEGKFYLYYSGHSGNLKYDKWVGVAVADHPRGPWTRFDEPLITRELDPEAERCTNNPSAIIGPDGKIWVFYSCRARGWEAIHAVRSDSPLGPFELVEGVSGIGSKEPSIKVEDGVIFKYDNIYYIIVKDKSGYYSGFGEMSNAFFYSEDCIHWKPAPNPKLFENLKEITWEDGRKERFYKLERAQIWWDESGKRGVLSMAAPRGSLGSGVGLGNYQALTIQIPLRIPE